MLALLVSATLACAPRAVALARSGARTHPTTNPVSLALTLAERYRRVSPCASPVAR